MIAKEKITSLREKMQVLMAPDGPSYEKVADEIWGFAETRYKEMRSSTLQIEFMEKQGFVTEKGIGKIATAFKSVWGQGKPVLGFLGEFDALPGLSQQADCPYYNPIEKGASGHGCGHNLLGTACMEAAVTLKKYMEEKNLPGTVIYFGCPAEESGAGKAFLVREGCFKDVDFAFSWHPAAHNGLMNVSLANVRIIFDFHGKSAHAAANPTDGRSALDACELTNVGVQYLREHVSSDVRMHSAYLNCGGDAPNVIPAEASLLYALRAPRSKQVGELIPRITDVGKGAALMTGCSVDVRVVSAYADTLAVPVMDSIMGDCMLEAFPLKFTEEEMAYAAQFAKANGIPAGQPVLDNTVDVEHCISLGSTDVGDVSWVVPTGSVNVVTMANGTPGHSWSLTAQGKSSIAYKGMHTAALIMAEGAAILAEDQELQAKAKESFAAAKKGEEYRSLLPDEVKPGDF